MNPNANKNALVVTSFAGFGDLLYLTPLVRVLAQTYATVDVWTRNPEPFKNNPYVRALYRMDSFFAPDPWDFYFQDIYYASPSRNEKLKNFPQSNIHTVDFFTVNCINFVLRDHEKDMVLHWTKKDDEKALEVCRKHDLIPSSQNDANIVTISPAVTWPSRTLPLEWYKELIARILDNGDKVVLIGKDINYHDEFDPKAEAGNAEYKKYHVKEATKQLYDASEFPGAICLYNQFTLHELAAFYSLAKVAVNSENGNMVVSCTNNNCWNVYVPTLTAPEFRLPYRDGSMQFKSIVVHNEENIYPASDYINVSGHLLGDVPIKVPSVKKTFDAYKLACKGFKDGRTRMVKAGRKNVFI
jgi:hypothetical protein